MTIWQLIAELREYDGQTEVKINGIGNVTDVEMSYDGYVEIFGEIKSSE